MTYLRFLTTLVIIALSFFLWRFDQHVAAESENLPRFVLNAETIKSWKETDNGIYFTLTEEAGQAFYELTKENVGKPVALYVETLLVSAPRVNGAIGGGGMLLSADEELQEKIRALLPEEKEQKVDEQKL